MNDNQVQPNQPTENSQPADMPQKPKFHTKRVLIVAVLAVLVAGGILAYTRYTTNQIDSTVKYPQINKQSQANENDIANWSTYNNEQYGFEFKYPSFIYIKSQDSGGALFSIMNLEPKDERGGFLTKAFSIDAGNNPQKLPLLDWADQKFGPTIKNYSSDYITENFPINDINAQIYKPKIQDDNSGADAFIEKGNLIIFIQKGEMINGEIFNQILSTFKFTP